MVEFERLLRHALACLFGLAGNHWATLRTLSPYPQVEQSVGPLWVVLTKINLPDVDHNVKVTTLDLSLDFPTAGGVYAYVHARSARHDARN